MLMKFDLCYLVDLDNGILFKRSFIAMCEVLNLNNDVLTKHNHKSLTVEFFSSLRTEDYHVTYFSRHLDDNISM